MGVALFVSLGHAQPELPPLAHWLYPVGQWRPVIELCETLSFIFVCSL
jgi:hypothetical protein